MPVLPGAEPFLFDAGAEAPATIVMSHGFTGSPQTVRAWGEAVHAAGYTVIGPRLPGHGTRWQDMAATRWQDWYGEVERALDEALGRGRPVVGMGISMGATLMLRLAQERGADLSGLVVVNPSLFSQKVAVNYLLPVISRLARSAPGIASDIAKPGITELAYDRIPLAALRSLTELWRLTRSRLGNITVPLRVYRSAQDHVVEPANSRMLLAGVSSEDVAEHVMQHSYHVMTLDNDAPELFAGSVAFVGELLGAAPAGPGGGAEPGR
ncbi:carboxylesterase [Actinorhabdospora filicis]|uniref:Carboxylesterase n=1 Tax=Actinorhabdospora filicis TaxID=1785913 RepID=A0A9W6SNB0_9ACTN|nr:alpha/beta fold hydrolase [Actinorhabdospora filicis]GLZ79014.1 carboxylesterase [Actinorhabdospora filicis]